MIQYSHLKDIKGRFKMSDGHWIRSGRDLEFVLKKFDETKGVVSKNYFPWSNAQEALYDRILVSLTEGVGFFRNDEQHETFTKISWAFPVIAYYHFGLTQQRNVIIRYSLSKNIYFDAKDVNFTLTPHQAEVLSRVSLTAGIAFNPLITEISLSQLEIDLSHYNTGPDWYLKD